MTEIAYTVHAFKEGETFVAYVPELDISSCGATREDAMRNKRDAVEGFLESSAAHGSLEASSTNQVIGGLGPSGNLPNSWDLIGRRQESPDASASACSLQGVIPAYSEIPVLIIKNPLRTAGMNRELLETLWPHGDRQSNPRRTNQTKLSL